MILCPYLDLHEAGAQKGSSCGHQCNDSSGSTAGKHLEQLCHWVPPKALLVSSSLYTLITCVCRKKKRARIVCLKYHSNKSLNLLVELITNSSYSLFYTLIFLYM